MYKITPKYATITGILGQEYITMSMAYDANLIQEIKKISCHKWSKRSKTWSIPLTLENAYKAKSWDMMFSDKLKLWANSTYLKRKRKSIVIPGLKGVLLPFQEQGVIKIDAWNGRALVADDMGLGKTVQALAWAQLNINICQPIIIICTATGKYFWKNMTESWTDLKKIRILSSTKSREILAGNVFILNYDIVKDWIFELKKLNPQTIILDEVHYIKTNSAKRTSAVKELCKGVPYLIELSGTPIDNMTAEIYNPINLINKFIFPNQMTFLHRYCDPKNNGYGWSYEGSTNSKELHDILISSCMIRRKKEDVLTELPDKIISTIPLEIDNRNEYNTAFDDFIRYVKNKVITDIRDKLTQALQGIDTDLIDINQRKLKEIQKEKVSKINALTKIEALKQLALAGKLNSIISWIDDFLESGEKLVIFCEHISVIDVLMKKYHKIIVKIDGSISSKKRTEIVETFQKSKQIRIFIGNKASQELVTLTASCNLIHIEFPWTPGQLLQRTDRVHRIGQKNVVKIYYLVAINTIEEKIIELLNKKMKMINAVMDGKDVTQDNNVLIDLINFYQNEK
jgi:SWI/SNF-related matrix-associated actin-dependent regulator 1 of chromatin subfamily A